MNDDPNRGRFPDGSIVGGTWDGSSRARKVAKCLWALHKHATGDRRVTGTVGEWIELLDEALAGDEMPADVLLGEDAYVNAPTDGPPAAR